MPVKPMAVLPLENGDWSRYQPKKSKKTPAQRLEVCGPCPGNLGGMCRHCGCPISKLTGNPLETCPVGCW